MIASAWIRLNLLNFGFIFQCYLYSISYSIVTWNEGYKLKQSALKLNNLIRTLVDYHLSTKPIGFRKNLPRFLTCLRHVTLKAISLILQNIQFISSRTIHAILFPSIVPRASIFQFSLLSIDWRSSSRVNPGRQSALLAHVIVRQRFNVSS